MQKTKVYKILLVISVLLIIVFGIDTVIGYIIYSTTLNSAPFYITVLANAVMYGVPSLICAVIGLVLRRKAYGIDKDVHK